MISSPLRINSTKLPLANTLVLYMRGPRSPRTWLERALREAEDAATEIVTTGTTTDAMEQLRRAACDVVIIDHDFDHGELLELILTIRAATHEGLPILIFGKGVDRNDADTCLGAGATSYLSLEHTTTRELKRQIALAAQQGHQYVELQQLRSWKKQHHEREQREILQVLNEQAKIFAAADSTSLSTFDALESESNLDDLIDDCLELLQATIVMGRGPMKHEVLGFVSAHHNHVGLPSLLRSFSLATKRLVRDRGKRSARHICDRANLLLFEVLIHWPRMTSQQDPHGNLHHHPDL